MLITHNQTKLLQLDGWWCAALKIGVSRFTGQAFQSACFLLLLRLLCIRRVAGFTRFPPLFCLELESMNDISWATSFWFFYKKVHLLYWEHIWFVSLFTEVAAVYVDLFTPIFYLKKEVRFNSKHFNSFGRSSVWSSWGRLIPNMDSDENLHDFGNFIKTVTLPFSKMHSTI